MNELAVIIYDIVKDRHYDVIISIPYKDIVFTVECIYNSNKPEFYPVHNINVTPVLGTFDYTLKSALSHPCAV